MSKAIELLFVRELVKHCPSPPVITLVNPGFCASELARNVRGIEHYGHKVLQFLLARTTEVGSRTLVAGACAGPRSHGEYMIDGHIGPCAPWVTTPSGAAAQQNVYVQTLAELEKIEPGISQHV